MQFGKFAIPFLRGLKFFYLMLYSLILFLPFFNFILLIGFGFRFHRLLTCYVAICNLFLAWSLTIVCLWYHCIPGFIINWEANTWIYAGSNVITWSLSFSALNVSMLLTVLSISLAVHIYSLIYMQHDPFIIRFFSYLSLFTFFMLFFVVANDLVVLFFGWEGIGLCSYLLISFWYTRVAAHQAALKALIMNRIGDFFLLIGICLILKVFHTTQLDFLKVVIPYLHTCSVITIFNYNIALVSLIGFCLVIAVTSKSAQLGLHTWLPDAMEGPTPVSALIHAATMVTAGILLIIKLAFFFELIPTVLQILYILGGLTALSGGLIGLFQYDIKKIIAYSTCSQLGYMLLACGLSQYSLSFYHLINHAFFKALLFLTAGSIIHALRGEQDLRRMGGLVIPLPVSYFTYLIGTLALCGFPFLSGFYSKDFIIQALVESNQNLAQFICWCLLVATFLTTLYSVRSIYYIFFNPNSGYRRAILDLCESPNTLLITLLILTLLSCIVGYSIQSLIKDQSLFFVDTVFSATCTSLFLEYIPFYIKLLPIICSLFGFFIGYQCFSSLIDQFKKQEGTKCSSTPYFSILSLSFRFFAFRLYFDTLYNQIAYYFITVFSPSLYELFDKGVLEHIGPTGLSASLHWFSVAIDRFHSFHLFYYQLIFIYFLVLAHIIAEVFWYINF